MAQHPVPLMILARLAVDKCEQGQGLGAALLKDALIRSAKAADIAGIRALFVHAKNDEAAAFYAHFHFRPSPTDPHHLFLLMKNIQKMVSRL
jgi:GNAT superfamily N-acetyltransferase